MWKNKKRIGIILGLVLMVIVTTSTMAAPITAYQQPHEEMKNIIVMIPDGMSMGGVTLARWMKAYNSESGEIDTKTTLALDEMMSGQVRTYWQTQEIIGAITDSAPAGTTMATGEKTADKHIAVSADDTKAPYATILEGAKTLGKSTGIIATSNIQHATPAAFSSHYADRSRYDILGEQQVYQNMDVVLGSGAVYLLQPYRKDGENMVEVLKAQGYQYVSTKHEMEGITQGKLWGMFGDSAMAYEMDRETLAPQEPSLKEMTQKALFLLSQNEKGFFLMVEGSKIDWAAHANDPIGVVSDILAFDDAVAVALDYAKTHQDTMVLAMTDHGNGGITIGDMETTSTYSSDPINKFIEPLAKATLTGEGIEKMLNEERSNSQEVMEEYFGITDLSEEEIMAIVQAEEGSMNYVVGPMISKRANIGWTTGGHTGEDVTLFSYLPGDERIHGLIDNTDVANTAAAIWGLNLKEITKTLYVNANATFEEKGATVKVDIDHPENPQLIVTKGDTTLILPESKNYVFENGEKVFFKGITVQSNEVFYTAQEVMERLP
ncbi:MAG: alkaline phosphatase [Clostridiales bacterium]|nr:alkaline phosphatase [Clostridiales bacterium]